MSRWTWHGGGIAAARAYFGDGPRGWLDLSTGINPHCWPGADSLAIDWRNLPDERALRDLEEAAADYFGCDPDHLCAVPGTETGLRLAGGLLSRPAFHLAPTYRTHGEMVSGSVPLTLADVDRAGGSTLILANPNNPDGRLLSREALAELLAGRGSDDWLVVDEAFADCHPDYGMASMVRDDRRLVLFRSFGKFFGLAGVRLGFVAGPRAFIAQVRHRMGAWPVSAAALAIGAAAYRDIEWACRMRAQLEAEAAALDAVLMGRGYRVTGKCPLFRLIEIAPPDLFEHLARRAILTRPFDAEPDWLRLGLPGSGEGLDRLDAALSDYG